MSTRCNVVIKGQYGTILLYRHSDGYPKGVSPTLNKFCEWVKHDRIRKSDEQAAGWLILLGIQEYALGEQSADIKLKDFQPGPEGSGSGWGMGWKIGAYEPCSNIHGDIDYIHVVDLMSATWKTYEVEYGNIDNLAKEIGIT